MRFQIVGPWKKQLQRGLVKLQSLERTSTVHPLITLHFSLSTQTSLEREGEGEVAQRHTPERNLYGQMLQRLSVNLYKSLSSCDLSLSPPLYISAYCTWSAFLQSALPQSGHSNNRARGRLHTAYTIPCAPPTPLWIIISPCRRCRLERLAGQHLLPLPFRQHRGHRPV